MANKNPPSSRMGSDPLSWIRNTRDDETQAQETALPEQPATPTRTARPKMETVVLPDPAPVKPAEPAPKAQAKEHPAAATPQIPLDADQLQQMLQAMLAGGTAPAKRGRPRSNFREVTKASQEGLPEHWTRATFIVQEDLLDTLKDYAYTERITIRDAVQEALTQYLQGKKVIRRKR